MWPWSREGGLERPRGFRDCTGFLATRTWGDWRFQAAVQQPSYVELRQPDKCIFIWVQYIWYLICKILGFLSAPSLTTICTDPHTQQFHLLSPSLTSWWRKSTIYRRCGRKPVTVGKWGSLSAFIGVGSSEFLSGRVSQRSLPHNHHHHLKVMLISATLPHTWLVIALFKVCLFCHQHCWICL